MRGNWQVTGSRDLKGTWQVRKVSDEAPLGASPTTVPSPTRSPAPTPRATTPTAGEAFPGVPLRSGATLVNAHTVTGVTSPVFVPGALPGTFNRWEVKEYRVAQRPAEVTRFYQERMSGSWTTVYFVETQAPEYQATGALHRVEDGRTVGIIIMVEEADSPDGARLVLVRASQS